MLTTKLELVPSLPILRFLSTCQYLKINHTNTLGFIAILQNSELKLRTYFPFTVFRVEGGHGHGDPLERS